MGNCFGLMNNPLFSDIQKTAIDLHASKMKNDNFLIIFFIGGPGSGKGTQSQKISEKYGLFHIAVGDLLREEISTGSGRGFTMAKFMNEGDLVPTVLVLDLIKEKIFLNIENTNGFVIDGFPREKSQALLFQNDIIPVDLVIYLEVEDNLLRDRLQGRAVISGRKDDNYVIERRIKIFRKNKEALVKYFKQKLISVNGEHDVADVFSDVCNAIDQVLEKRESRV
ncbi:adenylate kinase isoenzyme 1-like [Belonocnema kinseyi]|uniref:adenylate kinase isoenzyme 1-like n=1 Tax=Belonocnema kinseyi TaxID=2817044 RepID=UPI00143CD387|nr:adenylate kinase isoenzyme 1-like [Belonocnema kinseyi]